MPVELVAYNSSGEVTEAGATGGWDVSFMPADAERAKKVAFGPNYYQFVSTYLVPPGSPIQALAEVDRPGVRVVGVANTTTIRSAERALKNTTVSGAKSVDEIRRLKRGYPEKPLYVVVDEMCASGGYYIASAADRIYVNKASIVGSVGVLMDSFGFVGTMEKLGVERRLLTAGENKGFLDPFSPQSDKHKAHAQAMLNEIHQQFISVVRAGRGKRLKETPETFSGLYWTGAKAVEMGLADGFGTVDTVARDIVKAEDIVDYTAHEGLPERVLKKFGAAVGEGSVRAVYRGAVPQVR